MRRRWLQSDFVRLWWSTAKIFHSLTNDFLIERRNFYLSVFIIIHIESVAYRRYKAGWQMSRGRGGGGGSVFGTTTILHRELPTATPYCDYWYSHTQQDSLNSHWLPLFLLSSDQLLTLSTYNLNTFPQHNNICHIGAEQQGKRRDKRGEERRQERRQERREKREPPSFVSPGWSLILSNLARPDYHRSHRI